MGDRAHLLSPHRGDRAHLPVPGGTGDPRSCPSWGQTPLSPHTSSSGQHPQAPELSRQHVFPSGQLVSSSHFTSRAGDKGTVRAGVPSLGEDRGGYPPGRSSPLGRDARDRSDVQVERSRSQTVPCGQQCCPSLQHTACPGESPPLMSARPLPTLPTQGVPAVTRIGWAAGVGGDWDRVPGTGCSAWGACCGVLSMGCRYRAPDMGCPVLGARHVVLSAGCPTWDAQDRVPGVGCSVRAASTGQLPWGGRYGVAGMWCLGHSA